MKSPLRRMWKWLGPGLITGAADNDPSGIATYSIAGARWGMAPLWLLLYILPFMVVIQRMCARIGALTGCGLAGNIRRHYPMWVLVPVAGLLVLANTFNVGADLYGMAGALQLLIPLPISALVAITSIAVLVVVVKLRYRQIETIFKWFALSLFVYGVALVVSQPDWLKLTAHALVPTFYPDKEYWLVLFAMMGTTISPYLFFWQASQEAEDLRQERPRLKVCKFHTIAPGSLTAIDEETSVGMVSSNLVSLFIVSLTASTLWGTQAGNITTLREAAQALVPFAGDWAFVLFTIGLVGSGLLAIPVLAGSAAYVVAEIMGWPASMDKPFSKARQFYLVMIASVCIGMLLPLTGLSVIDALYWAALANGLIAPLLIGLVIHMSNNPDIVGDHPISVSSSILGGIAMMVMLTGAIVVVMS